MNLNSPKRNSPSRYTQDDLLRYKQAMSDLSYYCIDSIKEFKETHIKNNPAARNAINNADYRNIRPPGSTNTLKNSWGRINYENYSKNRDAFLKRYASLYGSLARKKCPDRLEEVASMVELMPDALKDRHREKIDEMRRNMHEFMDEDGKIRRVYIRLSKEDWNKTGESYTKAQTLRGGGGGGVKHVRHMAKDLASQVCSKKMTLKAAFGQVNKYDQYDSFTKHHVKDLLVNHLGMSKESMMKTASAKWKRSQVNQETMKSKNVKVAKTSS